MATALIDGAQETVKVQAYSFSSKPIIEALVRASSRSVAVEIILDKGQEKAAYSVVSELIEKGLAVSIDRKHAIAHNKLIMIDGRIVMTGSFNFTKNAEFSNAENCLAIESSALTGIYLKNFNMHKEHSDAPNK